MEPKAPSRTRAPRRIASLAKLVLCGAVLAGAATMLEPSSADAAVVEKIAAVIGDDSILLSELRTRAAPLIRVLASKAPAGPQRTAAESQVYKDVLSRMVEETLEAQAAERMKVTVSPEEIDRALENVAGQQKLTVDELLLAAEQRSGLSEVEYRAEIRRQVLEGKLLSQRVRGRIRITEEDLKNAYTRAVREERERREYRPEIILLKILPGSSPAAIATREQEAQNIYNQLKAGASFEDMAKQYSDEPKTKDKGGDMGIHAPIKTQAAQMGKRPALAEEVEARLMPLEPGEITAPFRLGDAILIMGVKSRQPSRFTTYEAAKEEMVQRLQNEILARENESWLADL
ncbi:MAG: peptidylprolyl isomerase [Polyangiaceae bacterium]|nr:peptidylprolyl isomerase [Polyangiaceae bacterium]